jgi:hypothetical protein
MKRCRVPSITIAVSVAYQWTRLAECPKLTFVLVHFKHMLTPPSHDIPDSCLAFRRNRNTGLSVDRDGDNRFIMSDE